MRLGRDGYLEGKVLGIFTTTGAGAPVVAVTEAHAVPGKGIEGDRYYKHTGAFSDKPGDGRDITLIEVEAVEAIKRECGIEVEPAQCRRNILTQGVALNHLVGREFNLGTARLKGTRLAEPCEYLEGLTKQGIRVALIHRGGLRANVISEGTIRVGDPVGI
jgi:MOSC domain-containing protein YiiM